MKISEICGRDTFRYAGNSVSQRGIYEWVGRCGDGRTNVDAAAADDDVRSWRPSLTDE